MKKKRKQKSGWVIFRFDMREPFVLLILEKGGKYGFPKGKKKKQETKTEASIRESLEESGITQLPPAIKIGKRTIHGNEIFWCTFRLTRPPKHIYAHEAIRWISVSDAQKLLDPEQIALMEEAFWLCQEKSTTSNTRAKRPDFS